MTCALASPPDDPDADSIRDAQDHTKFQRESYRRDFYTGSLLDQRQSRRTALFARAERTLATLQRQPWKPKPRAGKGYQGLAALSASSVCTWLFLL